MEQQARERELAARLRDVRQRMARAALECGRRVEEVTLVAISKTFPMSDVLALAAQGQSIFGENRVQEAKDKWRGESGQSVAGLRLHFVGRLQSNKARDAVALFDVLHSLDRPKLAQTLARLAQEGLPVPRCFVQVNTGEEQGKAGVLPDELDDFVSACRQEYRLPIIGLMCLPPMQEEASLHFALLENLARRNGLASLSMGMSADFEAAIRHGATHIRVGSELFGARG